MTECGKAQKEGWGYSETQIFFLIFLEGGGSLVRVFFMYIANA